MLNSCGMQMSSNSEPDCSERIQSPEAGLGVCMIGEARSRVWCPNGKVYERDGILPDFSLIRSVCGLNQIR